MNILIIEDEERAAAQLVTMLQGIAMPFTCVGIIDNIEDARDFLTSRLPVDLIFLDIYLSDGISFDIFKDLEIDTPIIFTTAYDQYAMQAFDVNSIDYLLKPIRQEQLQKALGKHRRLENRQQFLTQGSILEKVKNLIKGETGYKQNFLIPYKDRLIPVAAGEFAWFELTQGVVRGVKFDKQQMVMEERSLEELSGVLHPKQFYRANRQYLINRKAIIDVTLFFNGRLSLNLMPKPDDKILISKAKTGTFKEWMNTSE